MFTKQKKIVFQANQTNYTLSHALLKINKIFHFMKYLNTNDVIKIDKNIIFTQNFNYLYGHFLDEIFVAYDFNEKFKTNHENFCLVNFDKNNKNCNEISNLLFGEKFINIRDFTVIEIPNVVIIEHRYNLETFHSFPLESKLKILSGIQINNQYENKNLFLTRKTITHRNRNLNNLFEIENELEKHNFYIVNPENTTYSEIIPIIQSAENIVITWGSALVNLIYAKPGAKICILKSNSYKAEQIHTFRNLIKNYNLNIKIIESTDDNNIETNKIIETFTTFEKSY